MWVEASAFFLFSSLLLYVVFGGADFGAGVWDFFASGTTKGEQRKFIDKAIAPIWEANHVWLILAVVILFTAFPLGFRALSEALHVPLELMLLGVVLRGAAFVFRGYGARSEESRRRWGGVFALSSILAPLFLGICFGTLTSGEIPATSRERIEFSRWLAPFPFLVGGLTLSVFALLAAVYLTCEAKDNRLVQDAFRRRAAVALLGLVVFAVSAALALPKSASYFTTRFEALWMARWSAAGLGGLLAYGLYQKWFGFCRAAAVALVITVFCVWGVAQFPFLIAPSLSLHSAAAPLATLKPLVLCLLLGGLILFPSLYWMLKVFKGSRGA